ESNEVNPRRYEDRNILLDCPTAYFRPDRGTPCHGTEPVNFPCKFGGIPDIRMMGRGVCILTLFQPPYPRDILSHLGGREETSLSRVGPLREPYLHPCSLGKQCLADPEPSCRILYNQVIFCHELLRKNAPFS